MVGLTIENADSVPICERFPTSPHRASIDEYIQSRPSGFGGSPRIGSRVVWKPSYTLQAGTNDNDKL
jgi:hypothetical protein